MLSCGVGLGMLTLRHLVLLLRARRTRLVLEKHQDRYSGVTQGIAEPRTRVGTGPGAESNGRNKVVDSGPNGARWEVEPHRVTSLETLRWLRPLQRHAIHLGGPGLTQLPVSWCDAIYVVDEEAHVPAAGKRRDNGTADATLDQN